MNLASSYSVVNERKCSWKLTVTFSNSSQISPKRFSRSYTPLTIKHFKAMLKSCVYTQPTQSRRGLSYAKANSSLSTSKTRYFPTTMNTSVHRRQSHSPQSQSSIPQSSIPQSSRQENMCTHTLRRVSVKRRRNHFSINRNNPKHAIKLARPPGR